MISHITQKFREAFNRLPKTIKKQAKEAFHLFNQNPYHPSFHFKRVHRSKAIYSVRISRDYHAVCVRNGDEITWFWIGSHKDYEELLSHL